MERYKDECQMLAYLAKRQLNLEKNRVKERFEDMSIRAIYDKICEELYEIKKEIFIEKFDISWGEISYREKENINFELLLSEIGDLAGCLAGLIAKANELQKSKEYYGA